jgi:Penicillin-Binding Protein C-terminus Family
MNNEQLTMNNAQTADSNLQPPTSNFQVRVTRPDNGTIYRLTPQTPIETQRIPVQAIVADGVKLRTLKLLVDGQSIGEFTASPARTFWQLQLGAHTLTARIVDEQGQMFESEPVRIVVTQ